MQRTAKYAKRNFLWLNSKKSTSAKGATDTSAKIAEIKKPLFQITKKKIKENTEYAAIAKMISN